MTVPVMIDRMLSNVYKGFYPKVVCLHRCLDSCAGIGNLFCDDAAFKRAQSHAPKLCRDVWVHEAKLPALQNGGGVGYSDDDDYDDDSQP